MHLCAFIAIFVPKLVAMVTPLCPLCMGVSQMNSSMAQTLSQNQTLHGYVAYNWSYGHFCDFLKIWLSWQRPLDPCNQKCLLWIGRPQKPPVMSNRILVISLRSAFICNYSNFYPKIGCHGNAPLSLVYGSVTDEFPDGTAISQNQTLHGYVTLNWNYGNFVIFWPILAKIWLPWQRPLDACNQKCLLWIGRPQKPRYK